MRLTYESRAPRAAALACAALAAVAALSGCASNKTQPTASMQMGTEGGTLELQGTGAMVQVPKGALSQNTTVTLAAAAAPVAVPGTPVGQVVEFTPTGPSSPSR